METDKSRLYVSFPPHMLVGKTVGGIMYNKLFALMPAIVAALYYFRLGALRVMIIAGVTALICEYGMQKFLKKELI